MKKILVPTDFSTNAANALNYALHLAKDMQAEIVLYNVYFLYLPAADVSTNMMLAETMQEQYESELTKLAKETKHLHPELKISYQLRMGAAVEEIVSFAREINADLIVVGLKGKNKLSDQLMGSTASGVIRLAHCPVLAIPEAFQFRKPENILFACDYKLLKDKSMLNGLREFVATYNASVVTYNVVENAEYVAEPSGHGIPAEEYLEEFPSTRTFAFSADAETAIIEHINEHEPDMLVMIPRHHNLLHRLFEGSVTRRISVKTKVPLLCLPETI